MTWSQVLSVWAHWLFVVLVSGCAGSEPALWPPAPGAPTKTVYVSLDAWHAMIGFQRYDVGAEPPNAVHAERANTDIWQFEEWGYAERAWYLEGRQGVLGVLSALLWPTDGVIEVVRADRLWADRTPQPPAERFTIALSSEGFERLRQYLGRSKESALLARIGPSRFYRARRAYHLFHHCHHYAALALREAGLPISVLFATTRSGFAQQLRRLHQKAFAISHGQPDRPHSYDSFRS